MEVERECIPPADTSPPQDVHAHSHTTSSSNFGASPSPIMHFTPAASLPAALAQSSSPLRARACAPTDGCCSAAAPAQQAFLDPSQNSLTEALGSALVGGGGAGGTPQPDLAPLAMHATWQQEAQDPQQDGSSEAAFRRPQSIGQGFQPYYQAYQQGTDVLGNGLPALAPPMRLEEASAMARQQAQFHQAQRAQHAQHAQQEQRSAAVDAQMLCDALRACTDAHALSSALQVQDSRGAVSGAYPGQPAPCPMPHAFQQEDGTSLQAAQSFLWEHHQRQMQQQQQQRQQQGLHEQHARVHGLGAYLLDQQQLAAMAAAAQPLMAEAGPGGFGQVPGGLDRALLQPYTLRAAAPWIPPAQQPFQPQQQHSSEARRMHPQLQSPPSIAAARMIMPASPQGQLPLRRQPHPTMPGRFAAPVDPVQQQQQHQQQQLGSFPGASWLTGRAAHPSWASAYAAVEPPLPGFPIDYLRPPEVRWERPNTGRACNLIS